MKGVDLPLRAQRWTDVTAQRTNGDWAHQIKDLIDVRYPQAEPIVPVMDNLNAHSPASLYDAFPPHEAKRLADKLEDPPYAQKRQLAQHRRDRSSCALAPMSRPAGA